MEKLFVQERDFPILFSVEEDQESNRNGEKPLEQPRVEKPGVCASQFSVAQWYYSRGEYTAALPYFERLLLKERDNRVYELYWLLTNVHCYGIHGLEKRLAIVRQWKDLQEEERCLAHELFLLAGKQCVEESDVSSAEQYLFQAYHIIPSQDVALLLEALQGKQGGQKNPGTRARRTPSSAARAGKGLIAAVLIAGGTFGSLTVWERILPQSLQEQRKADENERASFHRQTFLPSSRAQVTNRIKSSVLLAEMAEPPPLTPFSPAAPTKKEGAFSAAESPEKKTGSVTQESHRVSRKGLKESALALPLRGKAKSEGGVEPAAKLRNPILIKRTGDPHGSSGTILPESRALTSPLTPEGNNNLSTPEIAPPQAKVTQAVIAKVGEPPQVFQQAQELIAKNQQKRVPLGWYRVMSATPLLKEPDEHAAIRAYLRSRSLVKVVGATGNYLKIAFTRESPFARRSLRTGYVRREDVVLAQSDAYEDR